jgi:hypothetical protein
MNGWVVLAHFDDEDAARKAAEGIAGATFVSVEDVTPRPPREPKSSAEDRAVSAVDRLCARARRWHEAWMADGARAETLWEADYIEWLDESGHDRARLRDRIELLRAARTLLRERIGADD